MVDVYKRVDKSANGFQPICVIDWEDGGITEVSGKEITLRGRNGEKIKVDPKSEHGRICLDLIKTSLRT